MDHSSSPHAFFTLFSGIASLGSLAAFVYLLYLASRVVKAIEKVADKYAGSNDTSSHS